MTVQILVGDCRLTMATLEPGRFHTCVTSPPYWGLRDYGTAPLAWPAIAYAPMAGLPPCAEVPAMESALGLEPTIEAFIGHMVQVFREVRRVLRDDATCWVNMGDCYATGAGKVNASPGGGTQGERWRGIRPDLRDGENLGGAAKHGYASGIGPMTQPNRMPQAGLKPKDLVGQPWRLAFALQADGWWLRSDVIWSKPNPMPESTKDRPTKAHEYFFLLSKSERYYYDAEAIKEPASEDTSARYARGRSETHKHDATASLVPGQRQQTIAKGFEHMRKTNGVGWGYADGEPKPRTQKPVAGWAVGEGDHSILIHNQLDPARDTKLLRRKLAAADSGTKNNDSFDAAMAVMPEARNKRSVWTVTTEGFPGAHFATFPTKLIEPCILAGCPEGGEVLDPFGGSGTTGLVADRLGRNAVICELNPAYASMAEQRVQTDSGHVRRQIGMELGDA